MRVTTSFNFKWLSIFVVASTLVGCASKEEPISDSRQHYLNAMDALGSSDSKLAIEQLTLSIEAEPDTWAYLQRAKLLEGEGETEMAIADCTAGLAIDPQNEQLKWLLEQLEKPKSQRFRGRQAEAPSSK